MLLFSIAPCICTIRFNSWHKKNSRLSATRNRPCGSRRFVEARNQNERATADAFYRHPKRFIVVRGFPLRRCHGMREQRRFVAAPSILFLTNANKRDLPVYAAIGNHDYMSSAKASEVKFKQRFPLFQRTGYFVTIGNAAFVLLNSNFSELRIPNHYVSEHGMPQPWITGSGAFYRIRFRRLPSSAVYKQYNGRRFRWGPEALCSAFSRA